MVLGLYVDDCRRCRRERESGRGATDRDNMTYCLIDELTGSNERWTINANDVLSFARQVAVAMVIFHVPPSNSYRIQLMRLRS